MNRSTISRVVATGVAAVLALGAVGCEAEPIDGNPEPEVNGGLEGGLG